MNANYLHKFNLNSSVGGKYLATSKPSKPVEYPPMTKEEIEDFRAFLRSGLTDDEYNKRKAMGTL